MENVGYKEIKRFLKLKAKAQEKKNLQEESECCNVLGNEYLKLGDYDNALLMHKNELHLCQTLHDDTGEAIACRNIGDVYVAMGKFNKAIEYHSKHLKLSSGNDVELQRANTSLGRTYLELGKTLERLEEAKQAFVKSTELLKESLRIVARLKHEGKASQKEINEMKIRSLINLGLCFHHLSTISRSNDKTIANAKSKEFFQKAMYLAKKFNFKEDLYLANYILSTVYSDQKHYSSALRSVEEAISLAKATKNSDLANQALDLCAQIHLLMENVEGAKSCLKKLYKRDLQNRQDIEARLKTVIRLCRAKQDVEISSFSDSNLFCLHESIADMYCKLHCFSSAVKHYKLQESLLSSIPSATSQQKRSVYFSIASTLSDADEYEEAIRYYYREIQCTQDLSEHAKTYTHIAACLEKMERPFDEVIKIYEKALKCSTEANDDFLTLRTLVSFEGSQTLFNDTKNLSETRSRIGELELKLGVCAEELKTDEDDESFLESSSQEEDELFEAEMIQSNHDDDSDSNNDDDGEPLPRRRRTNFSKTNEKGETQLHRACIGGQLKAVEVLVKQTASANTMLFLEIVSFLVKHGASINDTGGQHCDNITPINDAAVNGHFDVVQFLLDAGANPNIPSTQGKTALDSLTYYYHQHREDLDIESKNKYKVLYKRLKKVAGCRDENIAQTHCTATLSSAIIFESDYVDEERQNCPSAPPLSALIDDELPSLLRSRPSGSGRKRIMIENESDDEESDTESRLHSERKGPQRSEKVKKSEASGIRFTSAFDYLKSDCISSQRDRAGQQTTFTQENHPAALTAEKENVISDDWLVDDLNEYSQPIKKHKRHSTQLKRIQPLQSDWSNCEFEDRQTSQKPLFPCPEPTLQQPTTGFRIKVKIDDRGFIFAVSGRDRTIAWLTDKASARFEAVTKMKPILSLYTADGCLLSPDDAVFDVLNNNDTVVGKVESWKVVSFAQQYVDACAKDRLHVLPLIRQACEICQTTKTFQLRNLGYSYRKHLKPLLFCLGQQEVNRILLPGNRLDDVGMASFCSSLNSPSPNPRLNLVELDLTCCGLEDDSLTPLIHCPPLHGLRHLSLSYNKLGDGESLAEFLSKSSCLQVLNLECCHLTERTTESGAALNMSFENLHHLNLSQNLIGSKGVVKWLNMLNRSRLKAIYLRHVISSRNNTRLIEQVILFLLLVNNCGKQQDVQLRVSHYWKLPAVLNDFNGFFAYFTR